MIYVKSDLKESIPASQFEHFKVRALGMNEDGTPETTMTAEKEVEQQLRCIRVAPDGKHLACGEWMGNIRIFDLRSFEETQCIQAHDSEVTCIDYSPSIDLQG